MSTKFVAVGEAVSSSASSSFNSDTSSGPQRTGGEQRSPDYTFNTVGGPAGPSNLNINKMSGPRGAVEKPTSRVLRYTDPKDENDFQSYFGKSAAASTTTATASAPPTTNITATATAPSISPIASASNGISDRLATKRRAPAAVSQDTSSNGNSTAAATTRADPFSGNAIVSAFANHLATTFLTCSICSNPVSDPVVAGPRPGVLNCRQCCRNSAIRPVSELPTSLSGAIREVIERSGFFGDSEDMISKRRMVQIKRSNPPATSAKAAPVNTSSATLTPATGSASPSPNLEEASNNTTTPATAPTTPATSSVLIELVEAELAERQHISTAQSTAWAELHHRFTAGLSNAAPKMMTSRHYKGEADRRYEAAEYTASVELYTKALQQHAIDKETDIKILYRNRSAAHYMAQRYNDCIADCLEVVRVDPNDAKMISRAARSACTMGDLPRAIEFLQSVPKEHMNSTIERDLAKYRNGLETYQKAEKNFGTAEGDECYRMLVALLGDTIPFRVRFAESLQKQKHYERAIRTLEAISVSSRSPDVCRIMSECMYYIGFEKMERAKEILADVATIDDGCSTLLQRISIVDDGKQQGNTHFARKNYSAAVENYTSAIQSAEGNVQILRILYCNRAAAFKELGRYREGIDDCTKALDIDANFFKAYARRARCHQQLGDYFAAVRDYKKALELDSSDRELARELRAAEHSLSKEAEREKDYYYQLGITRSATDREIKSKYRELSLRWHPDKCIGMTDSERDRAEHKFKIISEAHATLIDSAKRREYDLKQDRERFSKPGGFGFASTYSGGNEYFRGRHKAGNTGFW